MKLSSVCEVNPGTEKLDDETLVSFVAMPDVSEDGHINTGTVRPYHEVKKGYTCFQEGDVLFAKITPCMENGKGALAVGLKNGFGCGSTEFHVLRPVEGKILNKWLYYLTVWPSFRHAAEMCMTGSAGQKRVPKSFLENYEINVPSVEQQTTQAFQLDRIKTIIETRKQQLQALDTLIKARFVEMFENDQYAYETFGDICLFLRNGVNIRQEKGTGGYPITRIETLSNDVFNSDRLGYAGITDLEKYQSYLLMPGDILISHINSIAYLGRAVQYRGELNSPVIHGMNLLCARIVESYDPTYIEFFFKTPMAKEYIASITKKAVNQASITITDLKKMNIPSPPIEEQKVFSSFVSQVNKTKTVIQAALAKAQLLFDSLMQQYFG